MHIFRCFLLLALIVAASSTACHRKRLRGPRPRIGHRHPALCKHYIRPKHHGGKFLGVFGFLSAGINLKLSIARDIFGFYANRGVGKGLDDVIEVIVNLSRGLSVIVNEWISGLGTYFERIVMGSLRLIFCSLRSPWQNGNYIDRIFGRKRCSAPSICGKDFGVKWGWRRYLKGYSKHSELFEFYNLNSARENIESLIEVKAGLKIQSLKGTRRLVVNILIKLANLLSRDIDSWRRDDFILIIRYVITIAGGIGRGFREGTGVAVVEELVEYISVSLEKTEFKLDISSYVTEIKEEVRTCERESFNGALIDESSSKDSSSKDSSSKNSSSKDSSQSQESSKSDSSSNKQSNENDSSTKTDVTVVVTTEEWDVEYDDNGEIIKSTKVSR